MHGATTKIAVVKLYPRFTTYIIGHANRILSYSVQHFLILTLIAQPCWELSAYWQQLSYRDNVRYWGCLVPLLLCPAHFTFHSFLLLHGNSLDCIVSEKDWSCCFLLCYLVNQFVFPVLLHLLMETQHIALPWFLPLCNAYFWGILLTWSFETCFQSTLIYLMDKSLSFGHRSSQPPRVWYSEIWGLVLANGNPFLCSSLVFNLAFQGTIWILIFWTSPLAFRIFIL